MCAFPYFIPDSYDDPNQSLALKRLYNKHWALRPDDNPLFSSFKYTRLEGFDYNGGDGTISRRDPSKIIKINNKYYVWYTKRDTKTIPMGSDKATDEIPSVDWDLSEIWYATSSDGFTWKEIGCAVPRPPKPLPGWRSVSTPDILVWEGKYYLYYQGFLNVSGKDGDDCPVAASVADSPDGPWKPLNKIVVPNGGPNDWDGKSIHDPYPLVHNGKVYLYFKSDFNGKNILRAEGVAIADHPEGPFVKHPGNPVINSGHETCLFPFKNGLAAMCIHNGNEVNTIQYAEDWVNFEPVSNIDMGPIAAGPYIPDSFNDDGNGRGINWGLSHFTNAGTGPENRHSILARFDCSLSLDNIYPELKRTEVYHNIDVWFSQGLSDEQKKMIKERDQLNK